MTPRSATPEDRDVFLALWHRYLVEMRAKGSEILPTVRTIDFYGDLFDAYVGGDRAGVALLVPGIGILLAGDCTPEYDSAYGRMAIGWGTYVVPEARGEGHAGALRQAAAAGLGALGFSTLLGSVMVGDSEALTSILCVPGVEVTQHVYRVALVAAPPKGAS